MSATAAAAVAKGAANDVPVWHSPNGSGPGVHMRTPGAAKATLVAVAKAGDDIRRIEIGPG
jgi:hypothetical protein